MLRAKNTVVGKLRPVSAAAGLGAAALCLALGAATANAAVLFQDDFNDGNINGWGTGSVSDKTITVLDGVVEVANVGTAFYTIRPESAGQQVFYAGGGATQFSVSADIQGNDSNAASSSSGELGLYLSFTTATSTNNRYDFRVHSGGGAGNDDIRIREVLSGVTATLTPTTTQTAIGLNDATVNTSLNHYELRVTVGAAANVIELLINNSSVLTVNATAVVPESVSVAVWGGNINDIRFDNVVVEAIPEPASAAALALLAGGLMLRRRRH